MLKINIIFILFSIAAFWWHLLNYLMQISSNPKTITLFAKLEYVGIIFVPVLLYHFIWKTVGGRNDIILKILYILSIIFEFILFLSNNFIRGFYVYDWGVFPAGGLFHYVFILFVIITTNILFYKLYLKYKEAKIMERKKEIIFLISSVFVFSLSGLDFFANHGINIYPLSFVFVTIFLGLIFYSISRFNLISTELILEKFFSYSVMILFTFFGLSVFEIFVFSNFLQSIDNPTEMVVIKIFGTLIFVSLFIFIYKNISLFASKVFNVFQSEVYIDSINKEIRNINDDCELADYLRKKINITLKTDSFLVCRQHSKINIFCNEEKNRYSERKAEIWKMLENHKEITIIDQEKVRAVIPDGFNQNFIETMSEEDIKIVVPIGENIFILLGEKNNLRRYTMEEIQFLRELHKMF